MPKFRKLPSPERQARNAVGRLVNLEALSRTPGKTPSNGTVRGIRQYLTQVAHHIAPDGLELLDVDPAKADAYLRSRAADLGQKALDGQRLALQKHLIHVRRLLPVGGRLDIVKSHKPTHREGRAYARHQIPTVAARQNTRNALATLVAYAAGLRAHELLTLARPDEQPPDVRPARPEKFDGRPGVDYTVVGKGGLVRLVRVPDHLAARLEERRLDERARLEPRRARSAAFVRPGAHGRTAARSPLRRRAGSRQPGAWAFSPRDHAGVPEVSRRPREPGSPRNDSTVRLIERMRNSCDYYRDLAVRIEAALLGAPVRDDYSDMERRIERALQKGGFQMPAASEPRRPRVGSRRRGGR